MSDYIRFDLFLCACSPDAVSAMLDNTFMCVLQAFLAASLKTDDELLGWFNERLVWNDQGVVSDLLKNGLFVRIFAPQV